MNITRIVRMQFREEHTGDFLRLFRETYSRIRHFEGCTFLELHRDADNNNVFYTISHWQSTDHLERYRQSELFRATWAVTKSYFSARPQAFTLITEVSNGTTA